MWIAEDIKEWWYAEGKKTYSDKAIEILLMVKALYGLPLRNTEGFVASVFKLVGIVLKIPDYSTVSRRAETMTVVLKKMAKENVHFILDSTGGKVYGEGEWKVRKHGWSKRRTWKKIHLGIDSDGEIRAVEVTDHTTHDGTVIDDILKQEDAQITDFYGDGAYDIFGVYSVLQDYQVTGFHIPPQKNAKIKVHGNRKLPPWPRDENLRAIRTSGRKRWKETSGYHTRSLGETVMSRFKSSFGHRLHFRTHSAQTAEVMTKANILNAFYLLGMPESVAIP